MIDWLQAQDHIFLSGITAQEPVVLALFPKVRGTCIHVHTTGDLPADAREAVEANMARNPDLSLGFLLNPGGTKNEEIKFCRAIFYEDDGPATLEEKLAQWEHCGLPRPSMQIWTGGKSVHNYWFLREPCSTAAFTTGQKLLFRHVESCLTGVKVDTSLSKPCQVLRLAGGVHPLTGEQSRVMSTTGERFELQQLMALVRPAAPAPEVSDEDLPHAKRGKHYERMTAVEKQQVVQEALRFCPEREAPGSGTYEAARDVLAAMVHEFGPAVACELGRNAGWSQKHWDIKKVAVSLVDAPEHRKTIWHVFKEAQRKGWVCPWPMEREVRNKKDENDDDALVKELRQRSYWQWAEARAAAFTLSSVFPKQLADLLTDRAQAFPVSDMALLAPFMTTLASVLGKRYWVQVATGWKEPCIFWMGTVAPAGSKKTPVANQFLWPLEHRDSEEQKVYKAALKEFRRQNPEDRQQAPELPRQRVVMDATLEALCTLLSREDIPGVVSFHDELSGFIGSMDKYRRNASDRAAWLSMWSGGGINILRKGSDPILVSKTSVSLFGAIQQDKLTDLLHGDDAAAKSGDGFWSRFLWVSPPYVKPRVMRDGREINQELLELVDLMDSMAPQQVEVVHLSDGAWAVFEELANRFTEEAESTYASRSAFLMKMHGYLARSAGLLWALDHVCAGNEMRTIGDRGPISREVMERAGLLCQFFLNQFDVLAPQVGGGDLPGWVVKIVELAKTRENRRVTARDLVTKRWAESGVEAKGMLKKLVDDYYLGRLLRTPREDQTWWELEEVG